MRVSIPGGQTQYLSQASTSAGIMTSCLQQLTWSWRPRATQSLHPSLIWPGETQTPEHSGTSSALRVLDSDVVTLADNLKVVVLSAAEQFLGRQKKKFQPWFTNELLDLCDQRRQLGQQKYIGTEVGLEYNKVNRELRKMRAAKKVWIEEQWRNTEEGNDVRKQQKGLQPPQGSHQNPAA